MPPKAPAVHGAAARGLVWRDTFSAHASPVPPSHHCLLMCTDTICAERAIYFLHLPLPVPLVDVRDTGPACPTAGLLRPSTQIEKSASVCGACTHTHTRARARAHVQHSRQRVELFRRLNCSPSNRLSWCQSFNRGCRCICLSPVSWTEKAVTWGSVFASRVTAITTMANIGLPPLAIEPSLTWCKLRTLHEHRARCGITFGPAMADKAFIEEVVKSHNEYRKRHQAEPLSHSKELSAQAQKWADHLAASGSFQHSNASIRGDKLGENIAMKWSSHPEAYTGQEVTDQWYSEVKMYQFGGEPTSLSSGHFTQVVWKGSREIGVGRAVTRDGKVMVVANYRPAGNMMGSFSSNVLPPKDGKIILPATTESKPRHEGASGDTFAKRFEEMHKQLHGHNSPSASVSSQAKTESRSVRTYTVTESVNGKKTTKTITEETIIKPDGEKIVNRKETVTSGEATRSGIAADFGRMAVTDGTSKEKHEPKSTGGLLWKSKRKSSSSSDSSPERSERKDKGKKDKGSKPQKRSDFLEDCLKAHNSARAKHGVPGLKLAKDLSAHAQKWAEELARRDAFEHSKCQMNGERVGENIACKWSSGDTDYTGQDVVDQWYSEIKKHNFASDGAMGSGHFTQVVWKDSKEVGVGKARSAGGKVIVVANYRPAGNLIGSYRQNVFPPK